METRRGLQDSHAVISVNQALLILLRKYGTQPEKSNQLKKLFFLGVNCHQDAQLLAEWMNDTALSEYSISTDPLIISEDPVRRYFETQYAKIMFYQCIHDVDLHSLRQHFDFLLETLPHYLEMPEETFHVRTQKIFSLNTPSQEIINPTDAEYHDALLKVSTSYPAISEETAEKMELIFKCSWLSVFPERRKVEPPMDIYNEGFFSAQNRGQDIKDLGQQSSTRSSSFGLMKSHMPMPRDDSAFTEEGFIYSRPADKMHFRPDSPWAEDNFKRFVHPFSCSLSGTLLMNLRWMLLAYDNGRLAFDDRDKLWNLLRAYIPLMIFNGGGHSFYEFTYPLGLSAIQQHFAFIRDFDQFTMEKMFFEGEDKALTDALHQTMFYLDRTLRHKRLHGQLSLHGKMFQFWQPAHPSDYKQDESDLAHGRLRLSMSIESDE